jgi:hypothetical protein
VRARAGAADAPLSETGAAATDRQRNAGRALGRPREISQRPHSPLARRGTLFYTVATRDAPVLCWQRERGCSSGVEHNLAKVGVEGSNPFTRSSLSQKTTAEIQSEVSCLTNSG